MARQGEMNILEMPLMFVWYDMIDIGEKPEEYREIKPYWEKRLLDYKSLVKYYEENKAELHIKRLLFGHRPVIENVCEAFPAGYTHIRFRRGYTKTTMLFEIKSISFGIGNPKWGAPKNKLVFIIKLGKRV